MHLDELQLRDVPMRHFVLEDDPTRIHIFQEYFASKGWTDAVFHDNVNDFMQALETFRDDAIPHEKRVGALLHLDHDLNGRVMVDPSSENCGSEVIRRMLEHDADHYMPMAIVIHSWNNVAALWMASALEPTKIPTVILPFQA